METDEQRVTCKCERHWVIQGSRQRLWASPQQYDKRETFCTVCNTWLSFDAAGNPTARAMVSQDALEWMITQKWEGGGSCPPNMEDALDDEDCPVPLLTCMECWFAAALKAVNQEGEDDTDNHED